MGANSFPLKTPPFLKGIGIQEVTKLSPLLKMAKKKKKKKKKKRLKNLQSAECKKNIHVVQKATMEDWRDCADALPDPKLRWLHMSEGIFSRVPSQNYSEH